MFYKIYLKLLHLKVGNLSYKVLKLQFKKL
jgi:hypothetical protein